MIFWVLLLPFAGALAALLVRNMRPLALLISIATTLAFVILLLYDMEAAPLIVLGRIISLNSTIRLHLAISTALLIPGVLASWQLPEGSLSWPLTLLGLGFLTASLAFENPTIATLLLLAGLITMVVVTVVPERRGSEIVAMRAMVVLMLAGMAALGGAWLLEGQTTVGLREASAASMFMLWLYLLLMGAFPFFIWQAPTVRTSSLPGKILFAALVPQVVLLHLLTTQTTLMAPIEQLMPILLLNAGIASFAVGCLGALVQQSLSGLLAYVAIAEMGFVLMGLGTDTLASRSAAIMHLVYRSLAVVAIAVGIRVLTESFGDDQLQSVRGAFRQAPLTVLGVLLAGLSLSGWPPMAGFVTRFSLYRAIAVESLPWAVTLLVLGLGPMAAFVRYAMTAMRIVPLPGTRREKLLPAIVVLMLGGLLLLLGLSPQPLTYLPRHLLEPMLGL